MFLHEHFFQDSWDAWENEVTSSSKTTRDEEKRLREEKRAARRAEMAAKREQRKAGPMKLGAKKDWP